MGVIGELFSRFIDVWIEIFSMIWGVLPKILSIGFWGIAAIFILPCVFVSSHLYPMWVEWGEDL